MQDAAISRDGLDAAGGDAGANVVSHNRGWSLTCAPSARYRGLMNLDNNGSGPITSCCTAE